MRFRNTLIALGLFAGLGAFIYFYEYKGEEGREKAERAGKSVLNIERDAIGEIEIVKPDAAAVAVRREGDSWRMTRPVETRADNDRVDAIVSTLAGLEVDDTLSDVTADEKKQFGIDPPMARVSVRMAPQGDAPAADGPVLLVGDKVPLGSNRYAARPGASDVLVVSGGLDSVIGADATSLRYRKVVGVDTWKVARFRIQGKEGTVALAHEAEHWKMESPGSWPADDGQVQNLWFDVQGAEAEGFETENPAPDALSRFGLTPPALTLTVEEKEGTQPVRVDFGHPDPNGPAYARRSDLDAVMRIPAATYDKLNAAIADPVRFRDARVAPVDRFRLTAVEIRTPGAGPVILRKDEAALWHRGDEKGPEIPADQANGLLDSIEALKATGYVEAAPAGGGEPELTLVLTDTSGETSRTIEARLLPASGPAGAPRRFTTTASTSTYLVSSDLVATLMEKVRNVTAPPPPVAEKP